MKIKDLIYKLKRFIFKALRAVREFIFADMRAVMKNFGEHDGELSTCALAFFLLISFIPLSLVIIASLSFFYKSDALASFYISQLKSQLPSINIGRFVGAIDKIIYSKRYLAFIWVPFLFWWGSFIFDIIERSLEKAFRIAESRRYWTSKIRHFIIIIGIAFFILGTTLASHFIAILKNAGLAIFVESQLNEVGFLNDFVTRIEKTPLIVSSFTTLIMNALLIFILYRFVPPKKIGNAAILKGALFASFSYEVVKSIFSYYISQINDYTSIFGSFNTIVILMIWIWYTCFLFVIGAEIAWVFHEKTTGGERIELQE